MMETNRFYTIRKSPDGENITCHTCRMTSYNPNDVKHKFCGNCRVFLGDLEIRFDLHRDGVLDFLDPPEMLGDRGGK